MGQKEGFGVVLLKYLNSTLLISGLLVGCSTARTVDINVAEQQWLDRVDHCMELASSNEVSLPKSEWFESLTVEEQKNVAGYLANYNDRQCFQKETDAFVLAIESEGDQEMFERYSVDLTPLRMQTKDRMKNIDMDKLMELQSEFNKPFSLRYVIENQGWNVQ